MTHTPGCCPMHDAAPEMLEALRQCITEPGATGRVHLAKYGHRRFKAINETARAAIAKAEGRGESTDA